MFCLRLTSIRMLFRWFRSRLENGLSLNFFQSVITWVLFNNNRDSLTKQATWKYPEISQTTENSGLGSIKAKFDIANGGPSCPSSVYVQFQCIDTILSGVDFELIGNGFRLSLVKRQFCTGKFMIIKMVNFKIKFIFFCQLRSLLLWTRNHNKIAIISDKFIFF